MDRVESPQKPAASVDVKIPMVIVLAERVRTRISEEAFSTALDGYHEDVTEQILIEEFARDRERHEEREARICPEDMGFEEYISRLQSRISALETARSDAFERATALESQVRELSEARVLADREAQQLRRTVCDLKRRLFGQVAEHLETVERTLELDAENQRLRRDADEAHADDLPTREVWIAGDTALPVISAIPPEQPDALGCLDTVELRIFVRPDQPKVGQHQVLLHEIIHCVEQNMLEAGLLTKALTEEFITEFAGGLLPILALSGLWPGLTRDELEAFYGVMEIADAVEKGAQ